MKRIKSFIVKWRNTFTPGNLILMYHRVNKPELDPWQLCVTPENFESHLQVLKEYSVIVSLSEIMSVRRTPGRRTVAITFDDGYADNYYCAKPLLEKYNVPATFFISTGQINRWREFWWDELEYLLLEPGMLPDNLSLTIGDQTYNWILGKGAFYSENERKEDVNRWPWFSSPGTRLSLYYSIWQKLYPLENNIRRVLLDEIQSWSGKKNRIRETNRNLTYDELFQLSSIELFEIGAHGVTHPVLPKMSPGMQIKEIHDSKEFLENTLGKQIMSFAYPHGEYNIETSRLVALQGFTSAFTTDHGTFRAYTDPFKVPRIQVPNLRKNDFEHHLIKWFRA